MCVHDAIAAILPQAIVSSVRLLCTISSIAPKLVDDDGDDDSEQKKNLIRNVSMHGTSHEKFDFERLLPTIHIHVSIGCSRKVE